ncbi:hypothetical protein J2853_007353 [Streptosporangium lutulentum]|uniref:Uncharacterized protein n=1 Tax=Streptosporangium lutulentum TaxID=1461250 RepID=A0ABT9QMZ7_9ACTN|nr:hypothetical protein [Streptosporangium lutulentum]
MAAHRRRRKKKLALDDWGPLAIRALLIVVDWWVNASGPR